MCVCSIAQVCPTLCSPMDCSPTDSSVYRIFQAGILEQVAISYPRGSTRPSTIYVCLSVCLSIIYLSIHLSIYPSLSPPIHPCLHSYHSQPGMTLLPKGHLTMCMFPTVITWEASLASGGWRPGTLLSTPYPMAPPQNTTQPQMSVRLRVRTSEKRGGEHPPPRMR